ncbi:MAG: Crp/Fnr family transcriptional regulator [Cyanobacteria bacterium M_surface_9_m1_291]|nr:Crp/Fnr family transcriptional regulator [Cyanobacteria bacterium M_surface_9_m1_291]
MRSDQAQQQADPAGNRQAPGQGSLRSQPLTDGFTPDPALQQLDAEQRITALLQLLVQRLGIRRGDWYELPLRLTHADLAELSGHTRVTATRQLSKWRDCGLIQQDSSPARTLRIAPELVEG